MKPRISEAARGNLYLGPGEVPGFGRLETLMSAIPLRDLDGVAHKCALAELGVEQKRDVVKLTSDLRIPSQDDDRPDAGPVMAMTGAIARVAFLT